MHSALFRVARLALSVPVPLVHPSRPVIEETKVRSHSSTPQNNSKPLSPFVAGNLKYPIGVSDYREIREEQFFHWDRSQFIKEFYEDGAKAVLILRPRRWAKSTTMSMVKYFFDITQPQLAHSLFEGTSLSQEDPSFCEQYCGAFPVISVSFGECRADTWEEMRGDLCALISRVYKDHRYLFDTEGILYDDEHIEFGRIIRRDPAANFKFALRDLTALLHRYHKKRVIVLIDEYDKPVNEAYRCGYFDKAMPFLASSYTGVLKDNLHLEKGLLTGVLRVAKAGYLSDLNNLEVYSLLSPSFADKYGVLEAEVVSALQREGLVDQLASARDYYDGYDTAIPNLRLYNPWSMLNYLKHKQLKPYWTETGRVDFIAMAVWAGPVEVKETLLPLLDGESREVPFLSDVDFSTLRSPDSLWGLLYFAGYVTGTVSNSLLDARIPNQEVKRELSVMWVRVFAAKNAAVEYAGIVNALLVGNESEFVKHFESFSLKVISSSDGAHFPEAFYHGALLGILFPQWSLGSKLSSNRESGLGRSDLMLEPVPPGKAPALIIELKASKAGHRNLKKVANEALKQIETKRYVGGLLPGTKRVILWGIAFSGREVAVKSTSINVGQGVEE